MNPLWIKRIKYQKYQILLKKLKKKKNKINNKINMKKYNNSQNMTQNNQSIKCLKHLFMI